MINTMYEFERWLKFVSDHANYCLDINKVDQVKLLPNESWSVEAKEDGVYCNVVCIRDTDYGNTVKCFSRDGKQLSNLQWTEREFRHVPQGVYIAEATILNGSFEDASRFFNPNVVNQLDLEPGQRSFLNLFDFVSLESFVSGVNVIPYHQRNQFLGSIWENDLNKDLTDMIDKFDLNSYQEALMFADHYLLVHPDCEGVVLRRNNAGWKRGARNEDTIKIVRYAFYDLRITGIQVGKGKHAFVVGAVVVAWKAFADAKNPYIKIPVDGKISYEERRDWYVKHSKNAYLENKIAKVRSKGLTNKGMLRQPKLIEIRWDKRIADL